MPEDIKLKEKYQELQESFEDLQLYFEQFTTFLPIAVCSITPIGVIISINKFFQELTDYNEMEIVGRPVETLFLEKEQGKMLTREVIDGEVVEKELNLINKKGEKIPVTVSASLRKDKEENILGYFLAIIEIVRFKKFQEELEKRLKEKTKELEDRTKALENSRGGLLNILEDMEESKNKEEEEKNKTLAIITNFADGLLVFDEHSKLSLINSQAENFFNVTAKETCERSIPELIKFPNLSLLINLLIDVSQKEENKEDKKNDQSKFEIREIFRRELLIKDDLVLEVSSIPLLKDDKKTGALVVIHDITREKMIEVMKTEFVSLAAHQLRTPLSAIKWTLKILLDGDLGELNSEQRDFIEKTYKSNERMIDLINSLLDVARIEEGRYLYKPVLTEIEPIIQFVVNSYKDEVANKKINFEYLKPKEKMPKVLVDVEKIRLVIQNFIENAINYTPAGGQVTISLKHDKKEIELIIKDSGVGIPKDQQARVFTKFFRAANVMRLETTGTGLGLFISKNIVEAHQGRIWFESEEKKGTTFHFALPIKTEFDEFITGF